MYKSQRYKDPGFDKKTVKYLQAMKLLSFNVLDMEEKEVHPKDKVWMKASVQTARSLRYSWKCSQKPGKKNATCNWYTSGRSLNDDEDFSQEKHAHLQTLGPYFSGESIIQFIDSPERLACLNWRKTISVTTAQ